MMGTRGKELYLELRLLSDKLDIPIDLAKTPRLSGHVLSATDVKLRFLFGRASQAYFDEDFDRLRKYLMEIRSLGVNDDLGEMR